MSDELQVAVAELATTRTAMVRAVTEIDRLREINGELLNALEEIVESASDGRQIPEWLDERLDLARAAIRKAETK